GWMVVPQVGISGFRIDLGIRHPDLAGAYLAGVECDGATYHGSATARDRDKVREQVLRGLGWNILRVWSTDWWFDAAGCAGRLHAGLTSLLDQSRARRAAEQEEIATHWDMGHNVEGIDEIRDDEAAASGDEVMPPPAPAETERVSVESPAESCKVKATTAQPDVHPMPADIPDKRQYHVTDLSSFKADPDQFFEFGYRDTLRGMIEAVIETESPLRTDI